MAMLKDVQQAFSMVTTRHESRAFSGEVMNFKTNLNHTKVVGAIVFFQLATKSLPGTAGAVDYTANVVTNGGLVQYYHDSYNIKTNSIYVEINGIRYHATDIPMENKQLAAYLNATNSLD